MPEDIVKIPVTGLTKFKKPDFIREFLFGKGSKEVRGEAFLNEMYRAWEAFCAKTERSPGKYDAFCVEVNRMVDLGILEIIREEPNERVPSRFPRKFYSLTAEYHNEMKERSE